ncbi:2-dehydro-3-deoxygalactonokinase [Chitinimonas naiadis]
MNGVASGQVMPASDSQFAPGGSTQRPAAIAIDWGSTHRRAYAFDPAGQLLCRHADAQGVLAVRTDFEQSLVQLLDLLGAGPQCQVLLSGMIGSRAGWVEAPYLPTPVDMHRLSSLLLPVPCARARVQIVPGVCDDAGPDVMRGEETQLLGAWLAEAADGLYLLPGTHSKWVLVQAGQVHRLHTFMTGELFASLRQHGTLAAILGQRADIWPAFDAGLADAALQGAASRLLFGIRAAVLRQRYDADEALSYLSGLLIGMEWADPLVQTMTVDQPLRLIGDPALAALYRRAAAYWQLPLNCLDPDAAYIAAARKLLQLTEHA